MPNTSTKTNNTKTRKNKKNNHAVNTTALSTPNITTTMHILTHPAHLGECAVRTLTKKQHAQESKAGADNQALFICFQDKFFEDK